MTFTQAVNYVAAHAFAIGFLIYGLVRIPEDGWLQYWLFFAGGLGLVMIADIYKAACKRGNNEHQQDRT